MNSESIEIKKKHTARNVLLVVLAALILLVGIAAFVFWRYIQIVSVGISYSEDEIHSMQAENDKKTNELLGELVSVTMRDLTDEERKLLASGELTPEQALALIMGYPVETTAASVVTEEPDEIVVTSELTEPIEETVTTAEKPDVTEVIATTDDTTVTTAETTVTTVQTEKKPPENADELRARIEEIIAEIYLLRATYLNEIDNVIAMAKQKYIDLPKEKHNLQGKMQLITSYLTPQGKALEAKCDASMDALLAELREILETLNESTVIIDEIKRVYKEQKDLKLAELTNQYTSKLN